MELCYFENLFQMLKSKFRVKFKKTKQNKQQTNIQTKQNKQTNKQAKTKQITKTEQNKTKAKILCNDKMLFMLVRRGPPQYLEDFLFSNL